VVEAAVVGVPDTRRGQIVKAFVVAHRSGPAFDTELQIHVQQRLSRHEYPRLVEVVDALPKTPAGKVNRKALRDRG
jgi:acetyl-CoA synthetase